MGTHNYEPQAGQIQTKPETHRLLTAAVYFLDRRDFPDCRKYALRASESDPTHPGPARILSIASVLSSPRHDYYAVLSLPRSESDPARIRSAFRTLASNLNPNVNPYPLAAEALDLVLRAWSVLSNPSDKARFDGGLLRSCTSGKQSGTFWTICPYCYYVYEFDRVYENCCLRCTNDKCRRVLHAVPIGAPPPPDVVADGRYFCAGFIPFRVCDNIGDKLWGPFARAPDGPASGEKGVVVDVSDDEDRGDGKRTKIEGGASNSDETRDGDGKKLMSGFSVKEVRMRRKKSVPSNSNKLMGRGVMVDSDRARLVFGGGEKDGNLDVNENVGDEESNGGEGGVEFFEGDDDVLIGLQCGFDLGNGDMSF